MSDDKPKTASRKPTRRTFVAMFAAAATAFVVKDHVQPVIDVRKTPTGKTRWIGHC